MYKFPKEVRYDYLSLYIFILTIFLFNRTSKKQEEKRQHSTKVICT